MHMFRRLRLMGSPQNPQFSSPVLLRWLPHVILVPVSKWKSRRNVTWFTAFEGHFPKMRLACMVVGRTSLSIIVWPSCVDRVHTAQPQSPSLAPSAETPVPTNRRFPFSPPGINRKASGSCGLRATALPLISSGSLLRTESLQHRARPAVSAQGKLCYGMRFCGLQTTSRSAS